MALPTAAQAAQNWATGMANSSEKMKAGIQAVTVSPTSKAADRQDAYVQGIQRAVASGKWQERLRAVTLQSWQNDMINKGVSHAISGAAGAKPKVQAFMQQFLQHLAGVKQMLEGMPRGDLETNIQRANAVMRANAQFKYSRPVS